MAAPAGAKAGKHTRLTRVRERTDAWTMHGTSLSEAHAAAQGLERMLAVTRTILALARAAVSRSSDACNTPQCILGHHAIAKRTLRTAVDGGVLQANVQETCAFDPEEGPRPMIWDTQAEPLARLQLHVQPEAKIKTKRLGRETYAKVSLGGGQVELQMQLPLSTPEDRPIGPEVYEFTLPSIILFDPVSETCHVSLKGELSVRCEDTVVVMTLDPDGSVRGTMEQRNNLSSANLQGEGNKGLQQLAAKAVKWKAGFERVGTFSGNWREAVMVECAGMGLQGVLLPAGSAGTMALNEDTDLADMPPMVWTRLWSAVLHALCYADAGNASGKGALDVLNRLAQRVHGYPVGIASTAPNGGRRNAAASPQGTASDEDEELLMMGDASTARAKPGVDTRQMPPCIKAEHAAGRHQIYKLELSVVHIPNSLVTRPLS